MSTKDEDDISRLSENVLDECNIYPLPKEEDVKREVKKVIRVMKDTSDRPTDGRIVRRVARAFELKQKMSEEEWIFYKGDLVETQR